MSSRCTRDLNRSISMIWYASSILAVVKDITLHQLHLFGLFWGLIVCSVCTWCKPSYQATRTKISSLRSSSYTLKFSILLCFPVNWTRMLTNTVLQRCQEARRSAEQDRPVLFLTVFARQSVAESTKPFTAATIPLSYIWSSGCANHDQTSSEPRFDHWWVSHC